MPTDPRLIPLNYATHVPRGYCVSACTNTSFPLPLLPLLLPLSLPDPLHLLRNTIALSLPLSLPPSLYPSPPPRLSKKPF